MSALITPYTDVDGIIYDIIEVTQEYKLAGGNSRTLKLVPTLIPAKYLWNNIATAEVFARTKYLATINDLETVEKANDLQNKIDYVKGDFTGPYCAWDPEYIVFRRRSILTMG